MRRKEIRKMSVKHTTLGSP